MAEFGSERNTIYFISHLMAGKYFFESFNFLIYILFKIFFSSLLMIVGIANDI